MSGRAGSRGTLADLLAPVTAEAFLEGHWEREPLLVARAAPEFYADVLRAADVDDLLAMAVDAAPGAVTILGIGEPGGTSPTPSVVRAAYRSGRSFRVTGAQRVWPALWRLCRGLEAELSFPVRANLYATPAGSHALDRHYDDHDVLVLQIAGSKRWRTYGSPVQLPLQKPPLTWLESEPTLGRGVARAERAQRTLEQCGDVREELVLHAGDLLYLPRGFVHEARTDDTASVHVTLGLHVITWIDVLTVALGQAGHAAATLRRALPVGFARDGAAPALAAGFRDAMAAFAEAARPDRALMETIACFLGSRAGGGEGGLHQPPPAVSADTVLERRPGVLLSVVVQGDSVGLCRFGAPGDDLWAPRILEPALRFVARAPRFSARDLPGSLSDRSRLVLVRRLADQGLLHVPPAVS